MDAKTLTRDTIVRLALMLSSLLCNILYMQLGVNADFTRDSSYYIGAQYIARGLGSSVGRELDLRLEGP